MAHVQTAQRQAQQLIQETDLRFIVERWDELSEPVKAGILAMVRAAEVPHGEADE